MAAFWASTRRSPLAGSAPDQRRDRPARRWPPLPGLAGAWRTAGGAPLPGAGQRRRLLVAWLATALTFLLRPWPPFQWLPGWCIGMLQLWAIGELVGWLWWPRRSA